jgi:ribonuclease III
LSFPEAAPPAPCADLAQVLGHVFERPELLVEAMTHPSALGFVPRGQRRGPQRSNQRLEFLGDRVLGLAVADLLWRRFADEAEGDLTRRFQELVRGPTLARIAADLELGRFLILPPRLAQEAINPAFLADACEAVIAAVYLDGGFAAAEDLIRRLWEPLLDEMAGPPRSPKTRLQEWTQARGLGTPRYDLVETSGPDHARRFTMTATVAGYEPSLATAASKQSAQEQAAAQLLETLVQSGPLRARRRRR